ncbi:WhiB family transcriptional regulator [Streptomyces sp. B21-108]|jgi:WhiB family redox-sensing transcriptional regulator|uniref:WhiB family transcriptional regulator n=1 Tax=Streptomyces sp. B21-108 TaxID=3039419 RepID=UPI002FF1C47C
MSRYDWMDNAQCAQVDPGLWHSEKGSNYTTAKRICRSCPVQPQCADHTARLDTNTVGRHGMWAGQTKKQREAAQAHAERQARRQAIVRLIERGGMDAEEIADHVGCSTRTVWRILADQRKQVTR